jgi:hypothetical protein
MDLEQIAKDWNNSGLVIIPAFLDRSEIAELIRLALTTYTTGSTGSICDIGSEQQHQEDSSTAQLLRLSLATPEIPCFLLLDDPANELFLSAGLGAHRVLTFDWRIC